MPYAPAQNGLRQSMMIHLDGYDVELDAHEAHCWLFCTGAPSKGPFYLFW
jgi:hypothetical protein